MGNPKYIYSISYHIPGDATILSVNQEENITQHYVGDSLCLDPCAKAYLF